MNLRTHEIGSKIFKWVVTVLVLVAVSGVSSCEQANGNNTKKTNTPVVPVVVRFDDSTIEVYKAGGSQIHPGDILPEGTRIGFELLKPPAGQQVDKWAINSKRLPDNGYTIVAADAVEDAGQKVIEITYTLKPAASVIVRFDENIINVNIEDTDDVIHNGDTVYEGRRLWLTLKNAPAGKQVDKWKINSKELKHRSYTINAADAVENAGQKVIEITYTLKPAEAIVMQFDESTIKVVIEGNGAIHNGDTVYEGRRIFLTLKNPPAGQQVNKWKINSKELRYRSYTVNAADAVENAGQKIIEINCTLKPAAPVVVWFDENTIEVYKTGGSPIHSGDTVYEGMWIGFDFINPPAGKQIDKWEINSKKLRDNGYTVVVTDAIEKSGKKTIEITYTLKSAASVIVRFDENIINVNIEDTDDVIHNGDTVYEGRRLWLTLKKAPAGNQVDKWEVNAKKLNHRSYTVNAADAVENAGQKVIEITCSLKSAEAVTVQFDESAIRVRMESNGEIHNGDTVYEGRRIFLTLRNPPAGQQIDKWKVNAKELNHRNYTVNAADAVEDAGKKTIVITYTLKPL
ncbi:hypothetical protein [Treponema vincentii]|uniref:hypothetical protein n=1 Tax=Treponema vincentii TaxID=69710 RepID=UPI003D9195BF